MTRAHTTRTRLALIGSSVAAVAATATIALVASGALAGAAPARPSSDAGAASVASRAASGVPSPASSSPASAAAQARSFLADWTDGGRVVRRDQGGDTVSEGQAYGMLAAVVARDESAFRRIWGWTDDHLRRSDGLLAWRWDDGRVVDDEPASDADLDTARALVLAGDAFDEPSWKRAGVALGGAILDHLTVVTPLGRILLPGTWATAAPYSYNPSYASPVAFAVLGTASGDARWAELEKGSAAVTAKLLDATALPPDWAQVSADGSVRPLTPPQGGPVAYGYDAARIPVRYAESCTASDRALAARVAGVLRRDATPPAVLDLGGGPLASSGSPLMYASRAAAEQAGGSDSSARRDLASARSFAAAHPTYYGAAWAALGTAMLDGDRLGGCAKGAS